MNKQHINNQKGEIEFRKKLYLQQVEQKMIFDDEFDANGIENILNERMKKTFNQMTLLIEKGISLSPYIEIGAERCQRSLVMENDLELNGAAVDISFDMLKSCDHYQNLFNKAKSPIRICCDANSLPFKTGSIPFIFCYETLHHFPVPTPITKEISRVLLPGGHFFLEEEPFKQVLHFNLYKQKKRIYSKNFLTRNKIKKTFDRFFGTISCNEVEHGIIENHNISLKSWKQALQPFNKKEIKLTSSLFSSNLFHPKSYLKHFIAYLLGGEISGICQKSGIFEDKNISIYNTLICPSCRKQGSEVLLKRKNSSFNCHKCSKMFPVINQVLFLFSYEKFAELYPDIFRMLSC